MEAEGDRNRHVAGRHQRRLNGQRSGRNSGLDCQPMWEREGIHQVVVGREVEGGDQHRALRGLLVALDAPTASPGEQAVNRQPVGVQADQLAVVGQIDLPACDREAQLGHPVRPGVEQWDAHGGSLRHVLRQTASLSEQLLATVAEGAAHHPGPRSEGDLDPVRLRARERACGNPLDLALADHPGVSDCVLAG
jgi:hypothetical protein